MDLLMDQPVYLQWVQKQLASRFKTSHWLDQVAHVRWGIIKQDEQSKMGKVIEGAGWDMAFRYDPGGFLLQPGITMLAGSGILPNFLPGERVKIDAAVESRCCIGWSLRNNLCTASYIASHHRTCTDYPVEEPHNAEGVTSRPFAFDRTGSNNHFGTWGIKLI
jgi:hypothetical protein